MDTLQKLLPPDQVGQELMKIAVRFEEKYCTSMNSSWGSIFPATFNTSFLVNIMRCPGGLRAP